MLNDVHLFSTAVRITTMVNETTQIALGTCIYYLKERKIRIRNRKKAIMSRKAENKRKIR